METNGIVCYMRNLLSPLQILIYKNKIIGTAMKYTWKYTCNEIFEYIDEKGDNMKGLRKYIAPFAPDQSGATAVFCELGGLVIILDAGGCAGNVCGFDEPRWFASKSAIFSAGLRGYGRHPGTG